MLETERDGVDVVSRGYGAASGGTDLPACLRTLSEDCAADCEAQVRYPRGELSLRGLPAGALFFASLLSLSSLPAYAPLLPS